MVKELVWHKTLKRPFRLKKAIDIGYGPTNILLVHGLGAKASKWTPLVNILEPYKYRVIAYDLLGFGDSPKPSWMNYSVNQHAKAILHSIKKDIGSKVSFIVIGHSMGCIVSTHIASLKNSKTNNLILHQPPLLMDSKRRISHKSIYEYIAGRPEAFAKADKLLGKYTGKFSSVNMDDSLWLPFERSLRNTILKQNSIEELKLIDVDTHIIYGRLDFVVSKLDAKKLSLINPNIKLHYVNEMHDIKPKSSKYIKKLIEQL